MPKAYSTTAVSGGTVAGAGMFDIGIKRTSGTIVGMMLRRNPRDVPNYQMFDDEYLASQFFTGEPGYGSLPSEKEISILQNDWRSGFGLEVYDASDSKRYRASNGMDMRFRGMGIAGPIATAVPFNTTAARVRFYNALGAENTANFHEFAFRKRSDQSWNSPTSTDTPGGWASVANTWDNDTGTYAINTISSLSWGSLLELNIAAIDIDAVRYWYGTNANITQIDIDLYYDGGWHHFIEEAIAAANQWNTVSLNMDLIRCAADFNDLHYIGFGRSLFKLNSTGNNFTFVKNFAAAITDFEVMTISGTEYLFIALGTSNNYQYMVAAETFTESNAVVNDFKYFKVVNAASPTMWGTDGNVTLRSTVNPLNGGTAWSGQTTVDAPSNVITGVFSDAGLLYITKEDMPYYLDSTGAVKSDLAPILATLTRSTDNGKSANYWLGNFYLPWQQSLLEENAGTLTWRSPNDYSTQLADFVGTVFAVAGDDHYLFAIVDNGTKIEVLAGRSESIDGTTRWVWHPINETTLTGCESCWVSAVYQKRLWISSTSSSDSLYYIPLPVAYGNVLADANRAFLTGTTMETSWLHGNFRSTVKAYIKLTLELGHTYNANVYFTAKYKLLEDTAWTTIGNFTGSSTSMIQSRYIPVDAESNNPKSTLFKLQFTAVTNDTTISPVLLNYQLKAVLYPDQREIIAMKVYCANDILLRDGGQDLESYDIIIATLNEARTATYPVTIYGIDGDVQTGKFLPLPSGVPRWSIISNEANRRVQDREYNLLFQIIPVA